MSDLHSAVAENFSITRGGPVHRLLRRLRPGQDEHVLVVRLAVASVLITWMPLLLLSLAHGLAYGKQVGIPFLRDFAVNARFLVALPVLILAEAATDMKLRRVVQHFLKAGLVTERELPSFEAVIGKVSRLRDRAFPWVLLAVASYIPSLSVRSGEFLMLNSSWHMVPSSGTLSYAGWWFDLVSAPLFRFFFFYWMWRITLWSIFLWRVSKLDLHLTPTHPDLAAGLGFVAEGQKSLTAIAFAASVVIAGQAGNAIAYEGATVDSLKFSVVGYAIFAIAVLTAPLLLLAPKLRKVREEGLFEYGILAGDYTQSYDAKWVHGKPQGSEVLLGSADIRSYAGFEKSFSVVRDIKLIPIEKRTFVSLAVGILLPFLPVVIVGTPVNELIRVLVKLIA